MNKKQKAFGMAAILSVSIWVTGLLAADFHMNVKTDSLDNKEAKKFVGQSVAAVTQDLGSPSMVRNNVSDPASIDYIFIGNSSVDTFTVQREGKLVSAFHQDGRGDWESSVYPGYPAKKK